MKIVIDEKDFEILLQICNIASISMQERGIHSFEQGEEIKRVMDFISNDNEA